MRNRITLLSIFLVLVSSSLGFSAESPKGGLRDSSLTFGGSLRLRYED